jgi:hypothetical protein
MELTLQYLELRNIPFLSPILNKYIILYFFMDIARPSTQRLPIEMGPRGIWTPYDEAGPIYIHTFGLWSPFRSAFENALRGDDS